MICFAWHPVPCLAGKKIAGWNPRTSGKCKRENKNYNNEHMISGNRHKVPKKSFGLCLCDIQPVWWHTSSMQTPKSKGAIENTNISELEDVISNVIVESKQIAAQFQQSVEELQATAIPMLRQIRLLLGQTNPIPSELRGRLEEMYQELRTTAYGLDDSATIQEAQKLLGMGRRRTYRYAKRGLIGMVNEFGKVVFSKKECDSFRELNLPQKADD